jgi:DNA-binding GntR family transcriptional regulator
VTKVRQRGFRLRELSADERDEAYALRGLIESYVVGRLAREATSTSVQALLEIVERQEQSVGDLTEFDEIGEAFHVEMAALVGPVWTAQIIEMLRGILWLSGLDAISEPGRPQEDVEEHRRIVDAVGQHNRRAAERALTDHLEATASAARRRRAQRVAS